MERFLKLTALFFLGAIFFSSANVTANAEEFSPEGKFEDPPENFLIWQEEQEAMKNDPDYANYNNAYIPSPVDLSHIGRKNNQSSINLEQSNQIKTTLPSSYNVKTLVTAVKNQGSYGTCWAHAAIGAMESNFVKTYGSRIDLSIMHLAWFTFVNPDSSKAFFDFPANTDLATILNKGGNAYFPTALYSRLDGAALMTDLLYPNQPEKGAKPSDFQRVIRLKDVFYLNMNNRLNANENEEQRNIVKQRIIDNGAVIASYLDTDGYYQTKDGKTTFYSGNSSTSVNHAIMIVGWDDNFAKENFLVQPSNNGAWLIKNSWGSKWGDSGYFWMSYDEYLADGMAFTVEDANDDMKCYYYDALGWAKTFTFDGASAVYSANVFKATRTNEYLNEVGFYVPDNNVTYGIQIYTGLVSIPSASPVNGTLAHSQSGTIDYAGYHTIKLNSSIPLPEDKYFSVVVRLGNQNLIPVEGKVSNFTDNATIEKGSFFSSDGTNWKTGSSIGANACVKAFTTTNNNANPGITTSSLSDAVINKSYSAKLAAIGLIPVTWTKTSGDLPTGLTMTSTGYIYGVPTVEGTSNFTVKAKNSKGSVSKNFSITVTDGISITTKSFSGMVGTTFNETLKTSLGSGITWSANGELPYGLSLNSNTGVIKGKPTLEGTYTVSFTASNSTGSVTDDVIFYIEAQATKPVIKISSLPNATVGINYEKEITLTGSDPIKLSVSGLPDGLSLDEKILKGTPEVSGTYTLKFTAENRATEISGTAVTKSLKLVIKDVVPVIKEISFDYGIVGVEYPETQLTYTGGSGTIKWSAASLPSGMKLTTDGLLYGTPKKAGKYSPKFTVKNSSGNTSFKTTFMVYAPPELSTTKLANATSGKNYSTQIKLTGSLPLTSFDLEGLPDGLVFSPDLTRGTGKITGISRLAGTYSLDIAAQNLAGSFDKNIIFKVNGSAPRISMKTVRKGKIGTFFGLSADLTGSLPINLSYSVTKSDLEKAGISSFDDLKLIFASDDNSFSLSGVPHKSVKNLPVTFKATNAFGTATKKTSITIAGTKPYFLSPDKNITITVLPNASMKIDIGFTGTETMTISATGLPSTMNIHRHPMLASGLCKSHIRGNAPSTESKNIINVHVTNADGKATRKITLLTRVPPKIKSEELPNATYKKTYSKKLTATGSKPITWKVISGATPTGLKFSSSGGNFTGKPTAVGDFTFKVQATNLMGSTTQEFTISVKSADVKNSVASYETNTNTNTNTDENIIENTSDSENIFDDDEFAAQEISNISENDLSVSENEDYALNNSSTGTNTEDGMLIIAELPEVEILTAGEYKFNITLDEDVPSGMELFFRNGINAENLENVKFLYDDAEIKVTALESEHELEILATLEPGVYAPVILAAYSENKDDNSDLKTSEAALNKNSGGCNSGVDLIALTFALILITAIKSKVK